MGLIRKLYLQVYMNVIIDANEAVVHVCASKRKKQVIDKKKHFEIKHAKLPKELFDFIEHYERKSPFSYVSLLYLGLNQGAKAGCSHDDLTDDVTLCIQKKRKKKTSEYTLHIDATLTHHIRTMFKQTGIDFIFSPFAIFENIFSAPASPVAQLFVITSDNSITMAVFKNSAIVFARHTLLNKKVEDVYGAASKNDEDNLTFEDDDEGDGSLDLELDDMGLESDDELEELETLDDLESLDDLDETSGGSLEDDELDELHDDEELEDFDGGEHDEDELSLEDSLYDDIDKGKHAKDLSMNYHKFELIKQFVDEFYNALSIESSFIETVYIASQSQSANEDLAESLKEELYMEVVTKEIDLFSELDTLVRTEVSYVS